MTYKEHYPEFLEETMFAEHGTRVLITDRAADKYLDQAAKEINNRENELQWRMAAAYERNKHMIPPEARNED